jgi:hypothetical protein
MKGKRLMALPHLTISAQDRLAFIWAIRGCMGLLVALLLYGQHRTNVRFEEAEVKLNQLKSETLLLRAAEELKPAAAILERHIRAALRGPGLRKRATKP